MEQKSGALVAAGCRLSPNNCRIGKVIIYTGENDNQKNMKKVDSFLLAVDSNSGTEALLEWSTGLAQALEAKVWVVHIAAPGPSFVSLGSGPQYIRDARADELREEHRMVQAIADELSSRDIEAEGLLIKGPTAKMIVEEAAKLKAGLIILGRHEKSFLRRLMMGETSEELMRQSRIPLLVVPVGSRE